MVETRQGTADPRMGLGLAALGRPGYINLGHAEDLAGGRTPAELEARSHRMLDRAYAAGLRDFDAARSYGRAEEFLASWLRARKPDDVRVSSKWGYTYTADWRTDAEHHEIKDHSPAKLREQWNESERLLGDFLDLYQIHSAVLETGVLDDRAVIAELGRLKAQGLEIGLSLSGSAQSATLERALEVEVDGRPLFDAVQATYNIFETSAGPALQVAHERGLTVIIKEGVANGRLTERGGGGFDAAGFRLVKATALRLGCTMDALALAFVLESPFADVVLSGAATVEQLDSNLAARALRLDDEARHALGRARQDAGQYWQFRSGLTWT